VTSFFRGRIIKKSNEIKLCLAWNRPVAEDKITGFLRPVQERNIPFSSIAYHFDGHLFWPKEKKPHSSWRKFNFEIQEGHIDREEFLSFCDELTILLELPKASLDLHNPGDLEQVLIRQAEKLGIGIYPKDNKAVDTTSELKRVFSRFHRVARQLRSRYNNRETIEVNDEYDVQDLLHALLRLYFDDVRAEEWTPSYAGKSARMDFLLKNEKVVIEVPNTLLNDSLIIEIVSATLLLAGIGIIIYVKKKSKK